MTEHRRTGHRWRPIEDLPTGHGLGSAELPALLSVWRDQKRLLEGSAALESFQVRQVRSWSIETGILERLYTLTEGVTRTLLEQGFDASLIPHGESDMPAERLVRVLEDHRQAIEHLFPFVKAERKLSTSFVKELHAILTQHQSSCEAVDSLGQHVQVPLIRGDYKVLPNNPGDPTTGETVHEYCPPEHVAAEMDRLIAMHLAHEDVPYEVEAAWLHHRFTQIHPFQDGNGRVARTLATLVCLRSGAFPLVVMRDQRTAYIKALEKADRGDLAPLVHLFQRQQKTAFVEALSLGQQALAETSLQTIVAGAKERLDAALRRKLTVVHERAERLTTIAHERLREVDRLLARELRGSVKTQTQHSDPQKRHWFRRQIIDVANHFDYFADLGSHATWTRLQLRHGTITDFVVSFHHLGSVDNGVMVATALVSSRDADAEQGPSAPYATQPACDEVFTITAGRDATELESSFLTWLERSLQIGLDAWRRTL